MNNVQILKLTEGLGGEYLTKEIIKRSKDKNIIYLTEDVLLNTKCVQELAKYLENLIQRNKDLEQIEKEHKEENGRLMEEIYKKDRIINLMAEMLVKDHEWFYSEFDNYTKQDFIDYFTNKVEEDIKE